MGEVGLEICGPAYSFHSSTSRDTATICTLNLIIDGNPVQLPTLGTLEANIMKPYDKGGGTYEKQDHAGGSTADG